MAQFVDGFTRVQAQVGRDLLVAAAAGMQLVSGFTDGRDELLLDEMVHVFRIRSFEQHWIGSCSELKFIKPTQNGGKFLARENACAAKGTRMSAAGSAFMAQKTAIEAERALPLLEVCVERLAHAPGPHLHASTPTGSFTGFASPACCFLSSASDRAGSPRMRMNPSASFWL